MIVSMKDMCKQIIYYFHHEYYNNEFLWNRFHNNIKLRENEKVLCCETKVAVIGI